MVILGLMSGTSLDGLDIACCDFSDSEHYRLLAAETYPYPDEWRERLASLHRASAFEYALADVELGHYFGKKTEEFRIKHPFAIDCIASHGHTVFHQPERKLTSQIGDGNAIHEETGLPVVYDFRRLDVALGGQGAPLVPIGDELLFGQYDACLNLGGIANISYLSEGRRIAFDICPCNMVINLLSSRLGLPYDPDGRNARNGQSHSCLMARLNDLAYYAEPAPKSLGKEWFESCFRPLVEESGMNTEDLLATVTSHIALQIAHILESTNIATLFVTGGGAFNSYLIELIGKYCPNVTITVPDPLIVNYKEAIIFALLGYLRIKGENNTLASVTGARNDSCGGVICGRMNQQNNSAAMPSAWRSPC